MDYSDFRGRYFVAHGRHMHRVSLEELEADKVLQCVGKMGLSTII